MNEKMKKAKDFICSNDEKIMLAIGLGSLGFICGRSLLGTYSDIYGHGYARGYIQAMLDHTNDADKDAKDFLNESLEYLEKSKKI